MSDKKRKKDSLSSSDDSVFETSPPPPSKPLSQDQTEAQKERSSRLQTKSPPSSKRQKRDREPSRMTQFKEVKGSKSPDDSHKGHAIRITRSTNRKEVTLPKLNRHLLSSTSDESEDDEKVGRSKFPIKKAKKLIKEVGKKEPSPSPQSSEDDYKSTDGDDEDEEQSSNVSNDSDFVQKTKGKKVLKKRVKKSKDLDTELERSDTDEYTSIDEDSDSSVYSGDSDFQDNKKGKNVVKKFAGKKASPKKGKRGNMKSLKTDEIDPLTLDGSDTETDGGQSDGGYRKLHGKEELNINAENEEDSSEDNHTDYDDEDYSYSDASGSEEEEEEDELQPSESASQGYEHPEYQLQKWKNKEKDELVSDWHATIKDLKTVDILKVKKFNVLYDRISSATEILPKITKDSYILLPPKDIEAYREACKKVAKVEHEDRNYPCYVCNQKINSRDGLKDHVRSVHLHDEPYQCGICPLKFGTQNGVKKHIESFHLFITYPCRICGYKITTKGYRNKHEETTGHVPRNKKLYVYATSGKITYRRQKRTDVVYCKDGKTFQIIIGLCRNKPKTELKRGAKSGVVVSYTSFGNAVEAMDHLFTSITKGAKSPTTKKQGKTRIRSCFARHEIVKGTTIDPRETIALRIYCLSEDLATQLKGWFRRYLNAICVMKTPETEIYLRKHESHLKAAVDKIFSQLPLTTRNFINKNKVVK